MSTPEDNLPPVEAPSASFFVQLFVVPFVIVASIMLVIFLFQWLANMGTKPEALVDDLAKLNSGSWQKALTVANLLADRRNAPLRKDPQFAGKLSQILMDQLQSGSQEPDREQLRVYLCLTLGALEIDRGVEALVLAARQEKGPADVEVRKTAIEALARLAAVSPEMKQAVRQKADVWLVLQEAATAQAADPQYVPLYAQLRSRAAFAMGVTGDDRARESLAGMLVDSDAAVRYNAATGLARLGDDRCVGRLVEMLDRAFDPLDDTPKSGTRLAKDSVASQDGSTAGNGMTATNDLERTTIVCNALRAGVQLHQQNSQAALDPWRQQVARLGSDPALRPVLRRGIEADLRTAQHLAR